MHVIGRVEDHSAWAMFSLVTQCNLWMVGVVLPSWPSETP